VYQQDRLPEEYLKFLPKLPTAEKTLIEQFYGLNGTPQLTLEQMAELRRAPDVNTASLKGDLAMAVASLRKLYERYGY
jgi:hypothetical protein